MTQYILVRIIPGNEKYGKTQIMSVVFQRCWVDPLEESLKESLEEPVSEKCFGRNVLSLPYTRYRIPYTAYEHSQ